MMEVVSTLGVQRVTGITCAREPDEVGFNVGIFQTQFYAFSVRGSVEMFQVSVEYKRVQTFLFAVPRLRYMVGANVMLGEMIRRRLCELAMDHGSKACPVKISYSGNTSLTEKDPLKKRSEKDPNAKDPGLTDADDPAHLYGCGILARDGGHFAAVFGDESAADNFIKEVESNLLEALPGLQFEIRKRDLDIYQEGKKQEDKPCRRQSTNKALLDLPLFQVCTESGNGPASPEESGEYVVDEGIYRSRRVQKLEQARKRFVKGTSRDIIGLLQKELPLSRPCCEDPRDFKDLCGKDYMAVIHADGNNVGGRYKNYMAAYDKKAKSGNADAATAYLQREAHGEQFFRHMRIAVRYSVVEALRETFNDYKGDVRPYQLLMLGGDDLLLVCRARFALGFVVRYARHLASPDLALPDGTPLAIGAGVVISSPNFPFHHVHKLAEHLASSAKRQRWYPDASVVDWMVCSQSWSEDPIAVRRRDETVRYVVDGKQEILALSNRPYRILRDTAGVSNGAAVLDSLEDLVEAAASLGQSKDPDERRAARSQLRYLVDELPKGKRWSELCFRELPEATLRTLQDKEKVGISKLWTKIGSDPVMYGTPLADLVDVYEIPYLGTKR